MNPELLTLRRMTTGVLFPPAGLNPVQVNRIYATITERYPYQHLQHLPDGARMANPDGDFFIQQSRIQMNERVVHFQSAREKCVDLFNIVQSQVQIPQFVTFGVKLTAFLPLGEAPMAAQFLEQQMLPVLSEHMELLGKGRQGVGVRIVLHQDGVHELKIEPFFEDPSQLYIELDVQHPGPFNDLFMVEPSIDAAYDYLFGEVKDFIVAFA